MANDQFKAVGAEEAARAFDRLPDDAAGELDDAAGDIAGELVGPARTAAGSDRAPQSKLLVSTIEADEDGELTVGGSSTVGRRRTPAYEVLFGSEYGSNRYRQFRRPRNADGYWLHPLIRTEDATIARPFDDAADDTVRDFERG